MQQLTKRRKVRDMSKLFLAILALISVASSSPLSGELEAASCTVTAYSKVTQAAKECKTLVLKSLAVPAGKTLQIDLLPGATLKIQGTISWAYAEWQGPLMQIKGNKVTVLGSGGVLDGRGAKWWDGSGDKGRAKPKLLRIMTTGGSNLKNIKIINCPHQCVSINSASDTTLDDFLIDVTAGDRAGGKNTDGFDISSSKGITVKNSVVKNQDDCVAVNQGSNMIFANLTCSGGHGLSLSVGQSPSSGSANTVKNVTFTDCTVLNSDNGIHIKTHCNAGTGSVSDITYKNIKLSGIQKYGINIQEDYQNGSPTGKPKNNIPIKNLKMNKVTGSMNGGANSMAVYIMCASGGCSNWPWSGISISKNKKANKCNFTPSGFKC